MATAQVQTAPVAQPADDGKVPLTPAEIEFNEKVKAFRQQIDTLVSSIESDMKLRQLPDKLKGDKVYGAEAANRTHINSFVSQLKKTGTIVGKLVKGAAKKSKGAFIGFSVPGYISPEMAMAIGLRPGESILWPNAQSKPIFSAALITSYWINHVMVHGLVHPDNLALFKSDDKMRGIYAPYTVSSAKEGQPPINLDRISYTEIQQLNKNFVEPRSKNKPGSAPSLDEKTENGAKLVALFKELGTKFKELGKMKDKVKDLMEAVADAEQQVLKAKAAMDKGEITAQFFQSYAIHYKQLLEEKEKYYAVYKQVASTMGI